ncbi:hypothetical protein [Halobacillus hunanensis]|uniref:hypothetical protein n=1 Tax=Halobacillus hunanensis TaxID=578214 RepID=UPI0009A58630|nr:hypothetical protein [Halobacillus hunanensis]
MKKFMACLLYSGVMGSVLMGGLFYMNHLIEKAETTYNMFPLMIFSLIYPLIMGMLFGLPQMISRLKRRGVLHFDVIKFAAIGLPALYIFVIPIFYYFTKIGGCLPLSRTIMLSDSGGTVLLTIVGVVLGYVLFESIGRKPDQSGSHVTLEENG